MASLPRIPIFAALAQHDPSSLAVVHSATGESFTYGQLLRDTAAQAAHISRASGGRSLAGERIAFLVENGYTYVGALVLVGAVATVCMSTF